MGRSRIPIARALRFPNKAFPGHRCSPRKSAIGACNAAMSAFVPPISETFEQCRAFTTQQKENVAMAKKEAKKLDELFHDTLKTADRILALLLLS